MGRDRPTTENEEAMIEIGPDALPPSSRQARIQQYYCELPDGKLKFVDLVLYFQDEAISAAEAGALGLLDVIENVEPASS
tara:strand:- start:416 stop:655 length:240 start_codon:yes stop_codon:yes gene_type:complete